MKRNLLLCAALTGMLSCGEQNKTGEGTEMPTSMGSSNSILPVDSQVVFCLSMISNLPASAYVNYGKHDSDSCSNYIISYTVPIMDSTLLYATDNTGGQDLKLSDWKRVWGPAVTIRRSDMIKGNPYVASASYTIFQQQGTDNYVVGIEATNEYSYYDWRTLDFNVATTNKWTEICPDAGETSGVLSHGTYLGLNTLINLNSVLDEQKSGVAFLDNIIADAKNNNKQVNIVVTGHSLGGALSPVFALYMQDHVETANATANANVYCMSTAGATPGDDAFAAYYNSKLLKNSVRVWNFLDVVPRGWDRDLMTAIKDGQGGGGLYSASGSSVAFDSIYICKCAKDTHMRNTIPFTPIETPDAIKVAVNLAMIAANRAGVTYQYICDRGTSFMGAGSNGTIYVNIDESKQKWMSKLLSILDGKSVDFLSQLGAQHVSAYILHYNMKQIHEYMHEMVTRSEHSVVNHACDNKELIIPELTEEEKKIFALKLMHVGAWGW